MDQKDEKAFIIRSFKKSRVYRETERGLQQLNELGDRSKTNERENWVHNQDHLFPVYGFLTFITWLMKNFK